MDADARVREGYGLTECVTGSCLMPENSDNFLSVGLPYADTFYKIIDSSGNELPRGETGQIILRGHVRHERLLQRAAGNRRSSEKAQ